MTHAQRLSDAIQTLFPELSAFERRNLALNPAKLKTAYRKQMLRHHPDRQRSGEASNNSHDLACRVQDAYEVLCAELRRNVAQRLPIGKTAHQRRRHKCPSAERFGAFLVREGLIHQHALNEALREQHHRRPSFGALAVSLGYLGPNELSRWLARQVGSGFSLGELLCRERRLTRHQVQVILGKQQAATEALGSVLTRLGWVETQAMRAALKRYHASDESNVQAA